MKLRYFGPRTLKRTVQKCIEKLEHHYERDDELTLVTGPFAFDTGNYVEVDRKKMDKIDRLNQPMLMTAGLKKGKTTRKKFEQTNVELEKTINRYRFSQAQAIFFTAHDVLAVELMYIQAMFSHDMLEYMGLPKKTLEGRATFQGVLAHELVHWDVNTTDMYRERKILAAERSYPVLYTDLASPDTISKASDGPKYEVEYFILNESIAHAVADVLFENGPPQVKHYAKGIAAEYLTKCYELIRSGITQQNIRSSIKTVKDIMDRAYAEDRSPLELL